MSRKGTTTKLAFCLAIGFGAVAMAAPQRPEADEGKAQADLAEIRKVSAVLDANVVNQANETIAGVEDLILSPEGRPLYAVLSRGGIVGVGASYLAIPWEALRVRHVDGACAVNLNMTKEALEKAPVFERENYQDLTNAAWVARVRNFFQAQTDRAGQARRETDVATADQSRRQPIAQVIQASKIMGVNLKNGANEGLGEVEELLMDRNDRIAFAIVGRGGVLDIGESYVPVPWSKFRLNVGREDGSITAMLAATPDQLKKAPLVNGEDYETLLGPGFAEQVHRYFGVESDRRRPEGANP